MSHLPIIIDVLPHVVHEDSVGGRVPSQEVVEAGVAVIEETDEGVVVLLPELAQLPGSLPHIHSGQLQSHQQGGGIAQGESSSLYNRYLVGKYFLYSINKFGKISLQNAKETDTMLCLPFFIPKIDRLSVVGDLL